MTVKEPLMLNNNYSSVFLAFFSFLAYFSF